MICPGDPYDQDIFGVRRVVLGGDEPSFETEVIIVTGNCRRLLAEKQQE